MEIAPLTPHLGAEVRGVDLSKPIDDATFASLHRAFVEWGVLVFRDQRLSREEHKAFGRRFGELHVHPSRKVPGLRGDPEIFKVRADEGTPLPNGAVWHCDVSCEERPPLGSMLYLKECPLGGDTLFANMHRAWEALSEPLRELLEGLTAVHDQRQDLARYGIPLEPGRAYPRAEHPVVVRHPETGRELLYVNEGFTSHIPQLTPAESRGLLDLLFQHVASRPELHCRVRWDANTATLWDNRAVQHHAVWDYFPAARSGERVSICSTERPSR
jgi:taurine dioxygenase